jgi:hypothetical protein
VSLIELDNGTMSQARLAGEVWDYLCYAGHRIWEGARSTIGTTFPFWQRQRYTRSERFPRFQADAWKRELADIEAQLGSRTALPPLLHH